MALVDVQDGGRGATMEWGFVCVNIIHCMYDFFHFSVHTNETTLINYMSRHDDS